jgi:uncharacterized protein YecT (DUF1311 family)
MRVLQTLLLFLIASFLYAQDQPAAVTRACKAVENIVIPKAEVETKCEDSAYLYYGVNGKRDYTTAHRCALSQWHNLKRPFDDVADETRIMPIATLVMVYANGDGVPRNVDLAVHIVCVDDPASASWPSFDELITRLMQMKSEAAQKFDFCSSGIDFWKRVGYECLDIQKKLDENQHMAHLSKLMSQWTPPQKTAFAKMMQSRAAFIQDESGLETTGGTGIGGQMIEAEHDLNVSLIDSTVGFDTGRLPNFTHQDYLNADKTLNAAYTTLMSDLAAQKKKDGCRVPESIRDVERKWLNYRDDWIAFARLRWPQVSSDSWLTLLERERTDQLGNIVECLP